eukprot:SAG31_NODE_2702_length_5221_cov_1.495705_2_plen_74_part_00
MFGSYKDVPNEGRMLKKFSSFGTSEYPETKHVATSSRAACDVRETMSKLFKLNGVHVDPDNIAADRSLNTAWR